MAKIFYEQDANWDFIRNKTVAIIGYGSQGHAHALNLKDSGIKVIVGLYEGSKSTERAKQDGLTVLPVAQAVAFADITMILIPDERQGKVFAEEIAPNLKEGSALAFAHGFTIQFNQVVPPTNVDVFMVAPKGGASGAPLIYRRWRRSLPIGDYQDYTGNAADIAMAYTKGIGGARAGVILTTFKEETETDLFGEQTVLCGGCTELVKAGFDTLVAAGYQPEVAYFECLHELKLIVDLMYEGGMANMRYSVSDTAEYGDYSVGKRIITDETRQEMKKVLKEIQAGVFARNWIMENQANRASFLATRRQEAEHPIEKVGQELRDMMSWLKKK